MRYQNACLDNRLVGMLERKLQSRQVDMVVVVEEAQVDNNSLDKLVYKQCNIVLDMEVVVVEVFLVVLVVLEVLVVRLVLLALGDHLVLVVLVVQLVPLVLEDLVGVVVKQAYNILVDN